MKMLTYINWGLVIFYLGMFAYALYEHWTVGTDKAGEGLAVLFLLAFGVGVGALFALNLLPYEWAKVLTLVLGLLPIMNHLNNSIKRQALQNWQASDAYYFKAKPMQEAMKAIKAKDIALVQELLPTVQATINEVGNTGLTLLHWAVSRQYEHPTDGIQMVQLLLDHGADPNAKLENTQPVLAKALKHQNLDIIQLLLDHGADPNAKTSQKIPLIASIFDGYKHPWDDPLKTKKAALLLKHGADPNVTFKLLGGLNTLSTLMLATRQKEWACCMLLLDAGADPDFESTSMEGNFRKMIEHHKEWGLKEEGFDKLLAHEALKN